MVRLELSLHSVSVGAVVPLIPVSAQLCVKPGIGDLVHNARSAAEVLALMREHPQLAAIKARVRALGWFAFEG